MRRLAVVLAVLAFAASPALAAKREPCSGKKGGVDHCDAGKYICKDGSKSSSKKVCER
jgi:hypothetical protein